MRNSSLFLSLLSILVAFSCQAISASRNGDEYVRDACSVTRYPDVCIRSLEPYSNSAKRSSKKWAQAALVVTLGEAKNVAHYLNNLKKNESRILKRRQRRALSDCIECFEDTVDYIQQSLNELRDLGRTNFEDKIGNIETWMSSALTYEDTCIDGFEEVRKGKQFKLLHKKVVKVTYITSNALAFVSKLASSGQRSLNDEP